MLQLFPARRNSSETIASSEVARNISQNIDPIEDESIQNETLSTASYANNDVRHQSNIIFNACNEINLGSGTNVTNVFNYNKQSTSYALSSFFN